MKTDLTIAQALKSFDHSLPYLSAGCDDRIYRNAKGEHAVMLRCENLTFREMAQRMGLCAMNAKRWMRIGSRELQRGMSRTKFRWL